MFYFQEYFRTLFHSEWGISVSKALTLPSLIMNLRAWCTFLLKLHGSGSQPRLPTGITWELSKAPHSGPTPSHWSQEFWKSPGWRKCTGWGLHSARRRTAVPYSSGLLQVWLLLAILAQFQSKKKEKKNCVTLAYLCSPVTFKSFWERSNYAPDNHSIPT